MAFNNNDNKEVIEYISGGIETMEDIHIAVECDVEMNSSDDAMVPDVHNNNDIHSSSKDSQRKKLGRKSRDLQSVLDKLSSKEQSEVLNTACSSNTEFCDNLKKSNENKRSDGFTTHLKRLYSCKKT